MPELAEVDHFRRQWSIALGETVQRVSLQERARNFRHSSPHELRGLLQGSRFESAEGHGKQMLFGFSGDLWLNLHLGMTGKLLVEGVHHSPQKHDHLVLSVPAATLVYRDPRQFGRIRWERSVGPPAWWRQLPPSIVSERFSLEHFRQQLARRPRSLLKPLLLDQAIFPGIGNWMADEVLWRAGLHPSRSVGELTPAQAKKLWGCLREVCRQALKIIGERGEDPPGSWLFAHRWVDGQSCPVPGCATPLRRQSIRGRTACWCPRCQSS